MAKGAYIGVNGVARKIKKGYVGVDGAARKIKKAYIGIGGVARPFWSGGELAKYGAITALSQARNELSAISNDNYALFGGGRINNTVYNTLDYYDKSLVKATTTLTYSTTGPSASKVGQYSLFAGGSNLDLKNGYSYPTVNAFSADMTRSTPTALSQSRMAAGGTYVSGYAIFAGGWYEKTNYMASAFTNVDHYNESLTRSTVYLPTEKTDTVGVRTKNHGIVTGGPTWLPCEGKGTYAFDDSLTITTLTSLSTARQRPTAASLNGSAIICGAGSATVERYNADLTRSMLADLSQAVSRPSATTIGDFAVIAGGTADASAAVKTVEVFDASFVKTVPDFTLTTARQTAAAEAIGNYAIFAGGTTATYTTGTNSAEAFTID